MSRGHLTLLLFVVAAIALVVVTCLFLRDDPVMAAVKSLDAQKVESLLNQQGGSIDSDRRLELIQQAIRDNGPSKSRIAIVKSLLPDRPTLFKQDKYGNSLLHMAASAGFDELVEYFLEIGFSVNDINQLSGKSPLHYACRKGDSRMVQLLLNSGADASITDFDGQAPIHSAIETNAETVKLLVDSGRCSIDAVDSFGLSPIFYLLMAVKSEDEILTILSICSSARPDWNKTVRNIAASDSVVGFRVEKHSIRPFSGETIASFAKRSGLLRVAAEVNRANSREIKGARNRFE